MRPLAVLAAGGLVLLTAACAPTSKTNAQFGSGDSAAAVATRASSPYSAPASSGAPVRASAPAATSASASGSLAPKPQVTTRVVVARPVTGHGTVASGYALVRHVDESVDCSGPANDPSPVAVNAGIDWCSPSAAYPAACWAGATPNTVLCYRNPFAKQVDLLSTSAAVTDQPAPKQPTPIALVLGDGSRCTVRIGGSGSALDGHPELFATYYCGNDAVWGPANSYGVNRTSPQWTVQLAPSNGHGPLRTVAIMSAVFVGTAS